ncbi:hypothetical protein P7C73_g4827, partial [Tremellales sp. Uapishka_1]
MPSHVLFVPFAGISHYRLLTQLSIDLVDRSPSLIATLLISSSKVAAFKRELAVHSPRLFEDLEGRWQFVVFEDGLDGLEGVHISAAARKLQESGRGAIKRIINGEYEGVWQTKVATVICDIGITFASSMVASITAELGVAKVPVLALIPTMAISGNRLFLPENEGGSIDGMPERFARYLEQGMDEATAAYRNVHNKLIEMPDLPPMYDSLPATFPRLMMSLDGTAPQSGSQTTDKAMIPFMKMAYDGSRANDGILILATPELDGAAINAMSKSYGCPVFGIGPQLPASIWSAGDPEVQAAETAEGDGETIKDFLDDALSKYGPNSALYISLGTSVWPKLRPSLMNSLIDSLLSPTLDPPIPFVFATASAAGKLSEDIKQKILASGRGLVVDWAPQVKILQHPATGFFFTHCGFGSIYETIMTGVPIVAMPFANDQPPLASFFTSKYSIGRTVHQMTSGLEGLTLANGIKVESTEKAIQAELADVWSAMQGDQGQQYRKNVEAVRDLLRTSWSGGGIKEGMQRLADFICQAQ